MDIENDDNAAVINIEFYSRSNEEVEFSSLYKYDIYHPYKALDYIDVEAQWRTVTAVTFTQYSTVDVSYSDNGFFAQEEFALDGISYYDYIITEV